MTRLARIKSHLEQGRTASMWKLVQQLGGRSKGSRILQVLGVEAAPPLAWQQRFHGEFGGAGVILSADAFVAEVRACPRAAALPSPGAAPPSPIGAAEWELLLAAELGRRAMISFRQSI